MRIGYFGNVVYDEGETVERREVDAVCRECGKPVRAAFAGYFDLASREPVYVADCPRCGRRRART